LIDAQEALALGVVSRISTAYEALEEIASAPAAATAEVKRRILMHAQGMGPAGLLEEESRALHEALLGR
jgi:enoyl-CoA hydratase/carnithine racemase